MDRNDADGAVRNSLLNLFRFDRERFVVGVAEKGVAAGLGGGFRGGDAGVRGRDDVVVGLDLEGAHRDVDRVRAVGAGDTVFHPERVGPRLLEGVHLRSADVGRLRNNVGDRGINFLLNAKILGMEIDERYFHL